MSKDESNSLPFDKSLFLKNLTEHPGIYQMLNEAADIIYVGKARNLKKRVSNYFNKSLDTKTTKLMQLVRDIKIIVTASESEALILENNLIKEHRPRYNVLFRDDKSYPYLYLSSQDDYPRLDVYRGSKKKKGKYFGPYPNAGSARKSLHLLQKLFQIRQCSNSFFKNRSRPCLQYQIKRCSAPCVELISTTDYQHSIHHAELFLQGKNNTIIEEIKNKMNQASNMQHYEEAARFRDLIKHLYYVQEQQNIEKNAINLDAIALIINHQVACVEIIFLRNGQLLGSKSYFPKIPKDTSETEILNAFLTQYYINKHHNDIPDNIIVPSSIDETIWLAETLSEMTKRKVIIESPNRGQKMKWLNMARENAEQALKKLSHNKSLITHRLTLLQKLLKLDERPNRIECFDISHTQGEATMASCVVYDESGTRNDLYRRFNIKTVKASDDYGAIAEVVRRRYSKLIEQDASLPDIILIDGGKGQVAKAFEVLQELQFTSATLLGLAKGPTRKVGYENLIIQGQANPLYVNDHLESLHVLLELRDESHRFAITGHRNKRAKSRTTSTLEDIAGVGQKRRREILQHFGGLQALKGASIDEIAKVKGISKELAKRIYDSFH